jgi:hypothetical protein
MTKLDWTRGPARRNVVSLAGGNPSRPRPPGISNDQARELGALQRELGVPYTGHGMTARQARNAIEAYRRQLDR